MENHIFKIQIACQGILDTWLCDSTLVSITNHALVSHPYLWVRHSDLIVEQGTQKVYQMRPQHPTGPLVTFLATPLIKLDGWEVLWPTRPVLWTDTNSFDNSDVRITIGRQAYQLKAFVTDSLLKWCKRRFLGRAIVIEEVKPLIVTIV